VLCCFIINPTEFDVIPDFPAPWIPNKLSTLSNVSSPVPPSVKSSPSPSTNDSAISNKKSEEGYFILL